MRLEHLVAPQPREHLELELKWLARLLGDVRDLDILHARLRAASPESEPPNGERPALEPLLKELQGRREEAARAVLDGLESPRYRALLTTLERAADYPPLEEAANEACCVALPPAAKSAWRRLRKAARDLRPDDPDDEFHEGANEPKALATRPS